MKCPINADGLCVYCDYSKENLCDYPYIGNREVPAFGMQDDGHWADVGCKYFSSCLNCPEPDECILEIPRYVSMKKTEMRATIVQRMQQSGVPDPEIAAKLNTTRRSIQRLRVRNLV